MTKIFENALTVKEIQDLDKTAIEKYGMPSIALMENAGRATAYEVVKSLRKKNNPSVCIICGIGNNAGDGFVVARHLINIEVPTKIFFIGNPAQLKPDAAINYTILKKMNYPITECQDLAPESLKDIAQADVVLDAIFGVGLNRTIEDPFKKIIHHLNISARHIISVDIPSGLDGTTGKIYGICIKAKKTVTFTFAKKGFYKNQGPKFTGKVVLVDIGIPYVCYK